MREQPPNLGSGGRLGPVGGNPASAPVAGRGGELMRSGLCASCVNESNDCQVEDHDGKPVLLCLKCREGSVRGFSFTEPNKGLRIGERGLGEPRYVPTERGDRNR